MLFEQRERWLDELHEYVVHVKEAAVCEAGFMPVPDILNEITEASADPREHRAPHQYYDWKSRARDLADAERWIGPNLRHHVGTDLDRIGSVITSGLLGTTKKGKPAVHDRNRPLVAASAATANALLDDPKAVSAAWRDLVTACRNDDHVEYPAERVKYLRDTVVALATRRRLDPGYHGPVQTAARVVSGSRDAVIHAQWMVGEPVTQPDLENIDTPSALSQTELDNLAARCVEGSSKREEFVVWFRIESAFVKRGNCVQSGDVTLYQGALLAGALTDHDAVREHFDVVPEELLTEELREIQAGEDPHKQPGEVWGFEWTIPSLVYARVEIHDIERHRAVSRARTLLDAVIQVNTPQPGTWKVLGGYLLLDGSDHFYYHRFSWGLKHEAAHTDLMYYNDHFTDDLRRVTAEGHVVTASAAESLAPVLGTAARSGDSVGVMPLRRLC
ncbi:hypothetical protein AXK57_00010 [Tsukamurella pulmonis]|uniref:hypothetical protein n=1 Tax=Tsukamurella pulmonis TaxID=47312 RepID=UPI0007970215|nr:hypothetical protein [Tsukamurella pulmonis]KXP12681.1 hypothetical protein AXK57_00010 [Tsukamurella pulmonis]